MIRARRIAAVVMCVAAGVFAVVGIPRTADSLATWTKPVLSGKWAGGQVWEVDTAYLDWVKTHVRKGEEFALIDGTGNVAISQWAPYQLYPAVLVEDPAEADWVVLYGIRSPDAGIALEPGSEELVYLDGFSIVSMPEEGEPDDGQ